MGATPPLPLPRGSVPKDGTDDWKQDVQKGLNGWQQRRGGEEKRREGGGEEKRREVGGKSQPQSWAERIRKAMEGARHEEEGAAAGDPKEPNRLKRAPIEPNRLKRALQMIRTKEPY